MKGGEQSWHIFRENREAVVAALREGKCDGIIPAARGFVDAFAEFLLEAKVPEVLEQFADYRSRMSIPMFFFSNVFVQRPLFGLKRLADIERVLFRSPYILRQLGFNAAQMHNGFYHTQSGQHPFDIEAAAECFARAGAEDFLDNQKHMLARLYQHFPGQFREGVWVMDSVHFHTPASRWLAAGSYKACVLGLWQPTTVWPMLWRLGPSQPHETVVGQQVFAAAEEVLGQGVIRHLLVDAGYLDGEWLTQLWRHGTTVTIPVREDMGILQEMRNLAQLADTVWEDVPPPKLPTGPLPQRSITGVYNVQGEWAACRAPLSACLIRDVYPQQGVVYQGLVTTAEAVPARRIYDSYGRRWSLEEVYMTLTCYWPVDDLPACRPGVAFAWFHFSLLAFTLLGLFRQETEADDQRPTLNASPPPLPMPEYELAVYAGPYFTLLRPSELFQIVFDHLPAWQAQQHQLLLALRLCEGST
jgi:hypothetical protein